MPSRLASFAAGTKSLSPEINIIWSTCHVRCLHVSECLLDKKEALGINISLIMGRLAPRAN